MGSVLKKKLLREKRRKRERQLEERDVSSSSDSDEDNLSKAKAVKSKVIHQGTCFGNCSWLVKHIQKTQKFQGKKHK